MGGWICERRGGWGDFLSCKAHHHPLFPPINLGSSFPNFPNNLRQPSKSFLLREREQEESIAREMGRAPCCDKNNVKRGPWSPEEDAKLKAYIDHFGTGGNWIALPQKIGTYLSLYFSEICSFMTSSLWFLFRKWIRIICLTSWWVWL
jgi:hypothetical protein